MRPPSGIITFTTDFGALDPYVGLMKGMAKREHLRADLIDVCHEVPAHDVRVGAAFFGRLVGRFPAGTVHVGVVDPGVGSARRGLAAFAHDCYWIAPDNGLLSEVLASARDPVVRILASPEELGLPEPSSTFHGRDVFAPLAGRLSSGRFGFPSMGRRVADPAGELVRLPAEAGPPQVVWVDRFGNLITNARADAETPCAVRIGGVSVPFANTYADAERDGELVALTGSDGRIEVAARNDRAERILGVGRGTPIELVHNPNA